MLVKRDYYTHEDVKSFYNSGPSTVPGSTPPWRRRIYLGLITKIKQAVKTMRENSVSIVFFLWTVDLSE